MNDVAGFLSSRVVVAMYATSDFNPGIDVTSTVTLTDYTALVGQNIVIPILCHHHRRVTLKIVSQSIVDGVVSMVLTIP